jgi:hypothetical protein
MVWALIKGSQDRKYDLNGDGKVNWHDLKLLLKCARKWEKPPKHDQTMTPLPTSTPKPAKTPKHDKATSTPTALPD